MLIGLLILLPMGAAPLLFVLGRRHDAVLDRCAGCTALIELGLSILLLRFPEQLTVPGILGQSLVFYTDGFRITYSLVTSILWLGTTLFSRQYFQHEREHLPSYWAFVMLTLGAAQGVMLSGSFFTTYVFFEILSLSSFPWVLQERTPEAIRAACTYLAVAVIGGLILLMGLLLLQTAAGTLYYPDLPAALQNADQGMVTAGAVCVLLGFGAKAGMYPLHVWLPKAHPVAPAPASALLSGLLTKVGIFGILMDAMTVFPGSQAMGLLVLILGTITMVLGAVLALFSVNLKRTLACSSMSQIGFILVGVAAMVLGGRFSSEEGVLLARTGLLLHMVNHSMLKLVLFLSAGAVAMNLHTLSLNDIRGWGRNKPLLHLAFGVGALGISGVPLLNGYLSKTLLHEGLVHVAGEAGVLMPLLRGVEMLFLISGGLTFAYMLKLYVCIFHEKNTDPDLQVRYDGDRTCVSGLSGGVLLAGTAILLLLGIPPLTIALGGFMAGEPLSHFAAFSWENLQGSLISLATGGAVYLGLVRPVLCRGGICRDLWPRGLDLEDTLYRPLLLKIFPAVLGRAARLFGEDLLLRPLCRGAVLAASILGRTMDTGLDALIVLFRKTLLREERVRDGSRQTRLGRGRIFLHATGEALSHVLDNFSYAMMMTCAGITLILALLALGLLYF